MSSAILIASPLLYSFHVLCLMVKAFKSATASYLKGALQLLSVGVGDDDDVTGSWIEELEVLWGFMHDAWWLRCTKQNLKALQIMLHFMDKEIQTSLPTWILFLFRISELFSSSIPSPHGSCFWNWIQIVIYWLHFQLNLNLLCKRHENVRKRLFQWRCARKPSRVFGLLYDTWKWKLGLCSCSNLALCIE